MPLTAETMRQGFSLLSDIHKQQDWIATLLESLRGAPLCVPRCGIGCNIFRCADLEAKYIAHYIPMLRKDVGKQAVSQIERWLLEEPRGGARPSEEEHDRIVNQPCPFCGDNGQCLIYPLRPINCRAWGVTRPAAEWCRRPLVKGEKENRRMILEGSEVKRLQAMLQGLVDFMRRESPELMILGFGPGLVYKNMHPKLAPKFEGMKVSMGILKDGKTPWIITARDAKEKAYKKGGPHMPVREGGLDAIQD